MIQAGALYRAEGLVPLVAIDDDDGGLISVLDQIMVGWSVAPAAEAARGAVPAIRVARGAKGWTCSGEGYDAPVTYRDPVSTACSLVASLYKAHTLIDHEGLVFHAAGVRIGAGLVLLTGYYRAGKSLFSAACAAAGLQVFSDDIIPLDPTARIARAPGLAIRLRLPLPEGLAPGVRDFVTAHNIAENPRYAYVCPSPSRLAPRDTTAPVAGIVALARSEGAPADLRRMRPADALGEVIRRNFARETPARRILTALEGLVDAVPCLRLTYDAPDQAVALLRETFEGGLGGLAADDRVETAERPAGRPARPLAAASLVRRVPGAHTLLRDGQAFLTDAEELVIFHLNATGAAVWRLIEAPTAFGEIVALFTAGFPDRDPEELAADLAELVRRLAGSGLVCIDEAAAEG